MIRDRKGDLVQVEIEEAESHRGHLRTFGRNVLLKNIGESSRLFQMVFFMVVARRFGPVGLGQLTVLLMVGSAVGLFVGDIGINTNLIARMSGNSNVVRVALASEAFVWKSVLLAASFILMCGTMYATHSSPSWVDMVAAAVISTGGVAVEFFAALMNGLNRFDSEAWLRIVYRGLVYGTASIIAFVSPLSFDLLYMAGLTIIVISATFFVVRVKLIRVDWSLSLLSGGRLLRESFPVWVTQLAQMTYLKFDVVILGLLHVASRDTGWYAAAWKIVDVLSAVPAILAISALPLLGRANATSTMRNIVPQYLRMIYFLPFFFALPLSIASPWIIRILYGVRFVGAVGVLRILIWAVVPIFVHTFLAVVAVASGRQIAAAKLAALASGLGMLTSIIVVPRFGYESMATVCLVANSLFALAMIFEFRDLAGSTQYATGLKSLGSALAIYGTCILFAARLHPVLLGIAGLSAYVVAMILLGVISTSQVRRVGEAAAGFVLSDRFAREMRSS